MRIVAPTDPAASPTAPPPLSEIRSLRLEAGGPMTRPMVDRSAERRDELERELDRVQHSLLAERNTYAQQMNWLMLSQALLLNAFMFVLILGWSTPLPAKRLLLVGFAIFAAVVAVLVVMALRGTRDAVMSLHQHRKALEGTLQKDFGRAPLYASRGVVTRGLAGFANGLLPATIVAGWIALTIYTLASPLGAPAQPPAARSPTSGSAQALRQTASAPRLPAAQVIEATPLEPQVEAPARKPASGGFKW